MTRARNIKWSQTFATVASQSPDCIPLLLTGTTFVSLERFSLGGDADRVRARRPGVVAPRYGPYDGVDQHQPRGAYRREVSNEDGGEHCWTRLSIGLRHTPNNFKHKSNWVDKCQVVCSRGFILFCILKYEEDL
jgi:hypothetical protein